MVTFKLSQQDVPIGNELIYAFPTRPVMATLFLFIGIFKFRSLIIHGRLKLLTKKTFASFSHGCRIRKLIKAKPDIILAKVIFLETKFLKHRCPRFFTLEDINNQVRVKKLMQLLQILTLEPDVLAEEKPLQLLSLLPPVSVSDAVEYSLPVP